MAESISMAGHSQIMASISQARWRRCYHGRRVIVIDHTGDVTLGGDLNAGSGDVSLKVDGAITNTGGLISGDGLTAYAGGPMTLHTKVNTLAASNVVGAIDVTETDGLTLSKVQAGNGPISVTAGGVLTASNVVSLTA